MTQDNLPRRPSSDLEVLREQLARELERLAEGRALHEPELYRAYLNYAQTLAWQGVAQGNLEMPGRVLDLLLPLQRLLVRASASGDSPAVAASLEIKHTIHSLGVAVRALESARVELRLKEERSGSEREVLRVLFENPGKYLGRKEVWSQMKEGLRRTPARIGQILVALHEEGLLIRTVHAVQGSSAASFYALSPRGRDVCQVVLRIMDVVEDAVQELMHAPEASHKARLSEGVLQASALKARDVVESTVRKGLKGAPGSMKATLEEGLSNSYRKSSESRDLGGGTYAFEPKPAAEVEPDPEPVGV